MGYFLIGAILFLVLALIYLLLRAGRHYAHLRGDPILTYRRVVALKKMHAQLRARMEKNQQRIRELEQQRSRQCPQAPKDSAK